jgi:2-desacetyl-2-hydroxyethyl bacteriochlorophyllide A dehydrogenase
MKAVRGFEGGVVVEDIEEPPGFGELIDVKSASICASDFLYLKYGTQRVLGHELAGVLSDGTSVVVEALYGCLECRHCLDGQYNLCHAHSQRALGITADGGMCEQYRAPATSLVPLPAGLALRDASLVEPASVSWHALNLANTGANSRVAVIGGGALGLLAAAGALRMGAEQVDIEARHAHQWEAAEQIGASAGTAGEACYDVVVEAAGTNESLAFAVDLVAPRGTVVVLGVHLGTVEISWSPLFHREASIVPSLGYCRHNGTREMDAAAQMLADNPEIARALITHRFGLDDAAEAFRVAGDRSAGAIRVVIEP